MRIFQWLLTLIMIYPFPENYDWYGRLLTIFTGNIKLKTELKISLSLSFKTKKMTYDYSSVWFCSYFNMTVETFTFWISMIVGFENHRIKWSVIYFPALKSFTSLQDSIQLNSRLWLIKWFLPLSVFVLSTQVTDVLCSLVSLFFLAFI